MNTRSEHHDSYRPELDPNWRKYVDLMRCLDLKGAFKHAKQWRKREPESPVANIAYASMCSTVGEPVSARMAARNALLEAPASAFVVVNGVLLLSRYIEPRFAIKLLEFAEDSAENSAQVAEVQRVLTTLRHAGNRATAVVAEDGERSDAEADYHIVHAALLAEGDSADAVGHAESALKLTSDWAQLASYAAGMFLKFERFQLLCELCERMVELHPADPLRRYSLARSYLYADQIEKAREVGDDLVRRCPDDPTGYVIRLEVLFVRGDREGCLQQLSELVKQSAGDGEMFRIALQPASELNAPQLVLSIADELLRVEPKSAEALYYKVLAALELEDYETATKCHRSLHKLDAHAAGELAKVLVDHHSRLVGKNSAGANLISRAISSYSDRESRKLIRAYLP